MTRSDPATVLALTDAVCDVLADPTQPYSARTAAGAFVFDVLRRCASPAREEACERLLAWAIPRWRIAPDSGPRRHVKPLGAMVGASVLKTLGAGAPRAWRVLPRAYARDAAALVLALLAWYALAARLLRRRSLAPRRRALAGAVVALVPASVVAALVAHTLTRPWVAPLLPTDLPLLVPLPLAATLSTALVCALAGVWASVPRGERAETPGEASP